MLSIINQSSSVQNHLNNDRSSSNLSQYPPPISIFEDAMYRRMRSLNTDYYYSAEPTRSAKLGFDNDGDGEVDDSYSIEYALLNNLLKDYQDFVRPAARHDKAVNVIFGLSLAQIIDVDEKNMIITTNGWLNQNWIDHKLRWNASKYGGIKELRIPVEKIWKPDIILYNNADPMAKMSTVSTNMIVTYEGNVTWLSSVIFKSSCSINVQHFPFDRQECQLDFASWTYDTSFINITLASEKGDISNFMKNGEWHLVNMTVKRENKMFSCCPAPYSMMHYNIIIQRRPLFYVFNMIFPCVVITLVSFLGFCLPPDSGDKVNIGITTLLSITVFLMLVAESMPPTSETLPLIGVYYGITLIIVSSATTFAVVTLNVSYKGHEGKHLSSWVKTIFFHCIAPILFIKLTLPDSIGTPYCILCKPKPKVENLIDLSKHKYHGEDENVSKCLKYFERVGVTSVCVSCWKKHVKHKKYSGNQISNNRYSKPKSYHENFHQYQSDDENDEDLDDVTSTKQLHLHNNDYSKNKSNNPQSTDSRNSKILHLKNSNKLLENVSLDETKMSKLQQQQQHHHHLHHHPQQQQQQQQPFVGFNTTSFTNFKTQNSPKNHQNISSRYSMNESANSTCSVNVMTPTIMQNINNTNPKHYQNSQFHRNMINRYASDVSHSFTDGRSNSLARSNVDLSGHQQFSRKNDNSAYIGAKLLLRATNCHRKEPQQIKFNIESDRSESRDANHIQLLSHRKHNRRQKVTSDNVSRTTDDANALLLNTNNSKNIKKPIPLIAMSSRIRNSDVAIGLGDVERNEYNLLPKNVEKAKTDNRYFLQETNCLDNALTSTIKNVEKLSSGGKGGKRALKINTAYSSQNPSDLHQNTLTKYQQKNPSQSNEGVAMTMCNHGNNECLQKTYQSNGETDGNYEFENGTCIQNDSLSNSDYMDNSDNEDGRNIKIRQRHMISKSPSFYNYTRMDDGSCHRYNATSFTPYMPSGGNKYKMKNRMTASAILEQQFAYVLSKIHQTIDKNEIRLRDQAKSEEIRTEWNQLALVLDRVFLLLFLTCTALSFFLILMTSPHFTFAALYSGQLYD
ncbi:hypothetical protein SNEBB_008709 [Seison nebaliae]|nr:hypothetical protein SNEBB_008709 [Seison nebaliae]